MLQAGLFRSGKEQQKQTLTNKQYFRAQYKFRALLLLGRNGILELVRGDWLYLTLAPLDVNLMGVGRMGEL